jgi:hypothetical protein
MWTNVVPVIVAVVFFIVTPVVWWVRDVQALAADDGSVSV